MALSARLWRISSACASDLGVKPDKSDAGAHALGVRTLTEGPGLHPVAVGVKRFALTCPLSCGGAGQSRCRLAVGCDRSHSPWLRGLLHLTLTFGVKLLVGVKAAVQKLFVYGHRALVDFIHKGHGRVVDKHKNGRRHRQCRGDAQGKGPEKRGPAET